MKHYKIIIAFLILAILPISCSEEYYLPDYKIKLMFTRNDRTFIVIESDELNDTNIIMLNDFLLGKNSDKNYLEISYFKEDTYKEYRDASNEEKHKMFKNRLYLFNYIKKQQAVKSLSKNIGEEWKTIKEYN